LRIEDNLQLASGSFNPGVEQLSHLAAGIINIPAVFGLLSGHFLIYNKNRERRSSVGSEKRNREA
jgi:predicted histidine transporter YuiF (NhaC family)